jgi:hypothetical protein
MTPKPVQWDEIARVFQLLAGIFRDEGRTELPPFDAMPSEAVDAACDAWCQELSLALFDAPLPPLNIRSWMLVRVLCLAAMSASLAKQQEPSPGPLTRTLVERLLIHEWHGGLRHLWPKAADDSQAFSL